MSGARTSGAGFSVSHAARSTWLLPVLATLGMATLGSLEVGLSILSACAETRGCAGPDCAPCAPAERWVTAGALLQGLLLALSVAMLVRGGRSPRTDVIAALLVTFVAAAAFAGTSVVADSAW